MNEEERRGLCDRGFPKRHENEKFECGRAEIKRITLLQLHGAVYAQDNRKPFFGLIKAQ